MAQVTPSLKERAATPQSLTVARCLYPHGNATTILRSRTISLEYIQQNFTNEHASFLRDVMVNSSSTVFSGCKCHTKITYSLVQMRTAAHWLFQLTRNTLDRIRELLSCPYNMEISLEF